MKYCEEYAALLDGFADGELDLEELERVRAHLETCPGCRAYVDDALAIRAGFPDAEDTAVPEGFAEGIMERVRENGNARFRRWAGTLAALAACCALVILLRSGPGLDVDAGGSAPGDMAMITAAADVGEPEAHSMTRGIEDNQAEAAPEEAAAADCAAPKDEAAGDRMKTMDKEDAYAEPSMYAALPAPAAAVPEEADAGLLLYLSSEDAGDLLDAFAPDWETETERAYKLEGEACRGFLKELGWEEPLPERVTVVIELSLNKE